MSFEVLARSLNCGNWCIKGDSGERSERKEEHQSKPPLLKERLRNHTQNIGRITGDEGLSGELSGGNEEHLIKTREKALPVTKWQGTGLNYVHALNVLQKVELVSDGIGYLQRKGILEKC